MSAQSARFLALVTRTQLAEMLSKTYAKVRRIDPNEAYLRLEEAFRDLELIRPLQEATWKALLEKRPKLEPSELIDHASQKLSKPKTWQPLRVAKKDEGAIAALTVLMDKAAGVGSGEALGLLDSPEVKVLLGHGFRIAGEHVASEMLR